MELKQQNRITILRKCTYVYFFFPFLRHKNHENVVSWANNKHAVAINQCKSYF